MAKINCLNEFHGNNFVAYHGDCVDIVRQLPENSIDYSISSPPFAGLYIYNDSESDMGNCADDAEFFRQYRFMVSELYRVLRPGRIVVVHCKDLVYYRNQNGTAGLRDFPGEVTRLYKECGFDYHSKITVWRDPVMEMLKTKATGLLWKQLRSDSTISRAGLPEYMLAFRKWPTSAQSDEAHQFNISAAAMNAAERDAALASGGPVIRPVTKTKEDFPLSWWRETASPVWMDTRTTDVLNAIRSATDEKHICPMPLDIIHRATQLWSNPGDVVLSPFMGIGSEGFVALKANRRFVGIELKESYWKQSIKHLRNAESGAVDLFDEIAA